MICCCQWENHKRFWAFEEISSMLEITPMSLWLTVMWAASLGLQYTNTLSPSETSAPQPLQDCLRKGGGGSKWSSGLPVWSSNLCRAEQPYQSHLSKPAERPIETLKTGTKTEIKWVSEMCQARWAASVNIGIDFRGNKQVCQEKQMWVQTSSVVLVFQEALPLVPKAFLLSFFLSLSLSLPQHPHSTWQ